jgi:hypothetical protein
MLFTIVSFETRMKPMNVGNDSSSTTMDNHGGRGGRGRGFGRSRGNGGYNNSNFVPNFQL